MEGAGDKNNKKVGTESVAVLTKSIQKFISEGNEDHLEHYLQQTSVRNAIVENSWEVVPELCAFADDKAVSENPRLLGPIEQTLLYLAETGSAKEMIVLIVEQLKEQNDSLFNILLEPIKICLLRIKASRGHSLALVLKGFYDHIARIPLPKEQLLEGKERLLLDLDENVQRINVVVPFFLDFLKPFVLEQAQKTGNCQKQGRSKKQVNDLTLCLVRLFDRPLAFLDLSYDLALLSSPSAKSTGRASAETVIGLLGQLHLNLVKAISDIHEENKKVDARMLKKVVSDTAAPDEESVTPVVGVATLCYLLFSENLSTDCIPCVYTHNFLFEFNIPSVVSLLQRTELLLIQKGLSLVRAVLRYLVPKSWSVNFLEHSSFVELIRSVVYVASTVKSNELSEQALRTMLTLLKVFEISGRVKLLQYLLKILPRGKVTGYVITMLMNEMTEAFGSDASEFFASGTEKLLSLVFALPKGEKTDLLDHSDRIVGALNLLRFLLLQDTSKQNLSGIWPMMPLIEQKYFRVLGSGIGLSRAHYQLELKKVRDTSAASGVKSGKISTADQVSLTKGQQMHVMQMAIDTFDMMEGILGKVTELVQRRKKERESVDHLVEDQS